MKKSTLALSVAAAIGSFGFIGNAMAIGAFGVGVNLATAGAAETSTAATAATSVRLNTDGIGHTLVVPYFSAQNANATLLNITNTDTLNGKVVKIRFRGAANSDDLFDFTVLLSPGDVWTGAVSQDPVTGLSLMKTNDASCALPASVKNASGQVFITGRVDPTPAKGSAINETREGYIEIITMADIPPIIVTTAGVATGPVTIAYSAGTDAQKSASLFGTTKHVSGVAPCSPTVLNARLGTDPASLLAANNQGMSAPTGMLAADWVILNQTSTAAWSGSATALQAIAAGANAASNLIFWPQKDIASNGGAAPLQASLARVGTTGAGTMAATADPLFTSGAVTVQPFDLPDLSTPLIATELASARANATSVLLAVTSVRNGFVTNSGIAGVTDFLFSQPTRRYSVAVNYAASGTASATADLSSGGTRAAAIYRGHVANSIGGTDAMVGTGSVYYGTGNTSVASRQVCLNSIPTPTFFDREESQVPGSFVISPGVATAFALCGETAVASINAAGVVSGSALNATVVRNDVTFGTGFDLGWATFATTGGNGNATATGVGPVSAVAVNIGGDAGNNAVNPVVAAATALPILGSAFVRVANGAVNYGFTTAHKVSR